ncbi:sulfate/molybdate ABC transporter ATP-binding protein [Xanthomonas rydalmerensis]|uniref:Sulfate/molybdate ABC transporter ATP-binding protein n=1 Tax=Xanthomonas rydalmerensis TaxID=3046274 RepID=A0ABZ0JLS2_9XANT|nr:sulfate/molybdate ABC transporter ATP-binding protein [Xanthomonas sp. DM-2023]WOS39975.1 sulfate/molybdate ABC transporter ATP-binding protein [Xanthomonas sp. DM-2023]WOS44159.1 sulfate/molybdate ABC transporter ATP-binding protein [Xanthomonas sp. DM-2023]WOS48339.1 sulfate/molybdate ABC transporter ATP-binding protein [Xanthomonas sp. DM-2023]WOS52519.1 sulfate/molybdate ABC transporter ATP-binding protein [Xanthomonas sp. DM-2023]WOS56703.1 sulfate/molybdate ABC transporter ATP-binding
MTIRLQHLGKRFGDFAALDDVSLDIRQGELLALLGPSGSGKTTLLRVIAGLEHADRGRVLIHGEDATALSVQARRVGFVFQHYALFKHMSVYENIAFGLRVRREARWSESRIRARVQELLALVQLHDLERRYPAQLSGGQRQRVALARALAIEPRVLLLDEPFGALDAQVRRDLRRWLRELHERTGLTTVFVTHDQEEALELADRVAILNRGRIEQIGSPAQVYEQPASPFVYAFVGAVNRLPARLHDGAVQVGGLALPVPSTPLSSGPVELYVRPEDLAPGSEGWAATVLSIQRSGPRLRLRAQLAHGHDEVEVELPAGEGVPDYAPGQPLHLRARRFGLFARPD